ncbi:sulfotransferase [Christiangramia sp. SM2212]|uniref:Sulfotransferase n=1 Tax=Christiangramia sediminicola TaxID=3073267 RepID=A0ABU1ELW0_9FLAO|nr:sulfotransferase [Christiangramia sp. SM2212]MDR5589341.1 sulfotransferase [Christiangramia sp. SM2212]
MNNKIFIVGVGRSGTSLLQSMLNAHSEVAFIPETHFLRKYVFTNKIFPGEQEVMTELKQDENLQRVKIDPHQIVNNRNSYLEVYNELLDIYLETKGKKIIGDKDPRNIDFLPHLKNYFPDAKIIHIIRDPRDVVLSRTKADWSKHWPFNLHAYMYNAQIGRGRKIGRNLFGSNYFEICYEDLIMTPEKELKKICELIGIDFETAMLEFSSSAKELVDKSELQWKKETMGPLLSSNKNKWKNEFSDSQIDLIQKVCNYTFSNLPYEKAKVNQSFVKNNIHKMASKIFKILYPLRISFLKK